MSDIFISYAREDRETEQRLAEALEAKGWSVWWDARLDGGEVWRQVIARELRAARYVIVLWSQASIESDWVLAEAENGQQRRILVPVKIEDVQPPIPFGVIYTVDLIDWNGHSAHPGFMQLIASFRSPDGRPSPPLPPRKWKKNLTAITILLLMAMPLTLLFVGWNYPLRTISFKLGIGTFLPLNRETPSLEFRLPPHTEVLLDVTSAPPVVSLVPDVTNPFAVAKPEKPSLKFYGNRNNNYSAIRIEAAASERFAKDTETKIEHYNPTQEERLSRLKDVFASESSEFDAVMIDIIWVGELASHLTDLQLFFQKEIELHDQNSIKYSKVADQLVAVPWFQNMGILFYREDLLRENREDLLREIGKVVPETWDELEKAARIIQAKQRLKDPEFVGFAWQGAKYEGLTCNALEWIASEGAYDLEKNQILFDNEGLLIALDRARRWVKGEGVISAISPDAQHHMEEESSQAFLNRKAAFFRGWGNESAILKQSGILFGVAPLPRGSAGKNFGVLGGWQLAVPKYSLKQRSAIEFIRYLSSPEVQEWRAEVGTYQPTIETVDVPEDLSFVNDYRFRNIQRIIRPSGRLGDRYKSVSQCIYGWVSSALNRNSSDEIKQQDIVGMKNCIDHASNPDIPEVVPSGQYDHLP